MTMYRESDEPTIDELKREIDELYHLKSFKEKLHRFTNIAFLALIILTAITISTSVMIQSWEKRPSTESTEVVIDFEKFVHTIGKLARIRSEELYYNSATLERDKKRARVQYFNSKKIESIQNYLHKRISEWTKRHGIKEYIPRCSVDKNSHTEFSEKCHLYTDKGQYDLWCTMHDCVGYKK